MPPAISSLPWEDRAIAYGKYLGSVAQVRANISFAVATPRFRSGHCQRTLPVGSSREAGRWVGTS
jgi:hypothetical protein